MKLNHDCIRDILMSIESMKYGEVWTIDNLLSLLHNYPKETLQYHCVKLYEAGLIDAVTVHTIRSPEQVARIKDLTYEGHQFLADIRSDTTWNKTKEIARNIGVDSLHALKDIAISVVTSTIQNSLGLH